MRWRLLRRCLIFALLGLVTSVAVAWGLSLYWQRSPSKPVPVARGVAVSDGVVAHVTIFRLFGSREARWNITDSRLAGARQAAQQREARYIAHVGGARYDREMAERYKMQWLASVRRIDGLAAGGLRIEGVTSGGSTIWQRSVGWPMPALRCWLRHDTRTPEQGHAASAEGDAASADLPRHVWSTRYALELPRDSRRPLPTPFPKTVLPLEPRLGLLLNTIFYGLLWAVVLLAPGALRRRIRRARGRCPKCGYSLAGQSASGCPECGAGRKEVAKWQSGGVAK